MACPQAWPIEAASVAQASHRPLHGAIKEETLEIRAVEVTGAGVGDAPMLPELLSQIPPDEDIATVTAHGAYDTRKCHDSIAPCSGQNAGPAIIPPRKNAKPWKPDTKEAIVGNEALRAGHPVLASASGARCGNG